MENYQKIHPRELSHLADKAQAIKNCFDNYHNIDRSEEYRELSIRDAEQICDTLISDFHYLFDTKIFCNNKRAFGLDDIKEELSDNKIN